MASAVTTEGPPPAKKRKLTFQEKEAIKQQKLDEKTLKEQQKLARDQEKQAREQERLEAKAKKDEEKAAKEREREHAKAQKDEEKRIKEIERKKIADEKEEKRREKEREKERKEAELRKKEESQLKLKSFFQSRSSDNARRPSTPSHTAPSSCVSSPCKSSTFVSPEKKLDSDYERVFLPFEPPSHTILAPANHFATSEWRSAHDLLAETQPVLDLIRSMGSPLNVEDYGTPSIRQLAHKLQTVSSTEPIDLTAESPDALLKLQQVKYLHFGEDVRPPYCGTFTQPISKKSVRRLMRNPHCRDLPTMNYDYDSEAEWEDPGEGEDLNSDGDEDADSDGADDMDDFLDDEDDAKRTFIGSDLEVKSTGLCWDMGSDRDHPELKQYRMQVLINTTTPTINPYSTEYWQTTPIKSSSSKSADKKVSVSAAGAERLRIPLNARPTNIGMASPAAGLLGQAPGKPTKRQVPDSLLPDFKAAIAGSDLTKIALVEALKKQFPKIPKDAIQNTLSIVAVRAGTTSTDKRWTLC